VKIGVVLQLDGVNTTIVDLAPPIDERGFESLWIGEHTHLPVDTDYPYPTVEDGHGRPVVPFYYKSRPGPLVTLAYAAALTSTVRLGTCISRTPEYNPIILAKDIATLDRLSNGRFEFGVGYGWNQLEMRNNGIDPAARYDIMREKLEAIRACWTQPSASYEGEFVHFTESWMEPKPVQQPYPPISLGSANKQRKVKHFVEFVDGWIAIAAEDDSHIPEQLTSMRQRAAELGRDPASIFVSLIIAEISGYADLDGAVDRFVSRLPDERQLTRWHELGIGRLILTPPHHELPIALRALDAAAALQKLAGQYDETWVR
jgi:probable F420-dependent oxidoreductase